MSRKSSWNEALHGGQQSSAFEVRLRDCGHQMGMEPGACTGSPRATVRNRGAVRHGSAPRLSPVWCSNVKPTSSQTRAEGAGGMNGRLPDERCRRFICRSRAETES